MDIYFNARYPFSKSAKEYAESAGLKLDYDSIEKGKRRAEEAVIRKRIPSIADSSFDLAGEIASYAIARMIVSQIGMRQAIESHAIAEAKRASAYLKGESEENLKSLARDFGIDSEEAVPVLKYLSYSPQESPYKLVNMKLVEGRVFVSRGQLIRVLEEAIKLRISGSLPVKMEKVLPEIKKAADDIKGLMPKPEVRVVTIGDRPPCITHMLERMAKGENLPHSARWTLTIYLLKSGMKTSDVIKLFSTSPDYSEKITRYQVEYILKKGYSMPSCKLIDSHGHCVYRCGIHSPLAYRGKKSEPKTI
ncbi:MAG: hypothetical protein V1909_03500 [Candidatus Micrarchaeota archaeon]